MFARLSTLKHDKTGLFRWQLKLGQTEARDSLERVGHWSPVPGCVSIVDKARQTSYRYSGFTLSNIVKSFPLQMQVRHLDSSGLW